MRIKCMKYFYHWIIQKRFQTPCFWQSWYTRTCNFLFCKVWNSSNIVLLFFEIQILVFCFKINSLYSVWCRPHCFTCVWLQILTHTNNIYKWCTSLMHALENNLHTSIYCLLSITIQYIATECVLGGFGRWT